MTYTNSVTPPPAPAPLLVLVSIDTEEDNWEPSRENIRIANIRALPSLHRTFEAFGVRPTYFCSYQVVRVPWARTILQDIAANGAAEIGAHLHPWNTPPMREAMAPRHTMMKNLPFELQEEKLLVLTDAVTTVLGTRPRSFRAGRYGLGSTGARLLARCGYTVDSSVTPFLDWRRYDDGPDHREAPVAVYRPSLDNLTLPSLNGPVVEVPVSVGFTRRPFRRWAERHERMTQLRVGPLTLASLAYRSHFLRKVQLSFETDSVRDMLVLTNELVRDGVRCLHLTWHSPSMVEGMSPFTRTVADRHRLRAKIDRFFDRLSASYSFSFATVAEAADKLAPIPAPVMADVKQY